MSLTGLEKAAALISILESESKSILLCLSEEVRTKLLNVYKDQEIPEKKILDNVLEETVQFLNTKQEEKESNQLSNLSVNEDSLNELSIESEPDEEFNLNELEDKNDNLEDGEDELEELEVLSENLEDNEEVKEEPEQEAEENLELIKLSKYLETQSVQLVSFYINHCEEEIKEALLEQWSDELKEEINQQMIHKMPISKRVFKNLKIKIEQEINKEEDNNEAIPEESELESVSA